MFDPVLEVSERLCEVLGRERIGGAAQVHATHLTGKRILVTGAGGSIGSAMAEALIGVSPSSLTLLDLHENSIFQMRQRFGRIYPAAPLRYVLADIRNRQRMRRVLAETAPEIIFHLAAYKHVPLAEELPTEFAAVNVLGTWGLLEEARRAGVRRFVYPSTDKAVNPPSIYGATKRSAELILQAAATEHREIQISVVRLVNVVGARGGVIETFARQIAAGLPVTITDPRMTRYWITMDEALLLLTWAAGDTGSGKIFLLDLGEPISVVAMAERMWSMLRRAGEPMRVEYSGSRPGERLVEELISAEEVLMRSDCPYVLVAENRHPQVRAMDTVTDWLAGLEAAVARCADDELRRRLFDFVGSRVRQ